MARNWTAEDILSMARAYQPACVLAAAADLDVLPHLATESRTAGDLAGALGLNLRGLRILLDALAALEVLTKEGEHYRLAPGADELLSGRGLRGMLDLARHQANCLRRWAQLARVVKTGQPAERIPSPRGEAADQEAFIGAMHDISGPMATSLLDEFVMPPGEQLLDIGGASGTWTIEFLRRRHTARATLFDLAAVIPLARRRLGELGLAQRVTLVAGDFYTDPLPPGADLAWLSAIVHQNSPAENRDLYAKIYAALVPGGHLLIRDVVMQESRIAPLDGALFAVNMLVGTAGGGTFTLREMQADLEKSGFTEVCLLRSDPWMNSIVQARKPGSLGVNS